MGDGIDLFDGSGGGNCWGRDGGGMVCDEAARFSYCGGGVVWWDAGIFGGDTDVPRMGVGDLWDSVDTNYDNDGMAIYQKKKECDIIMVRNNAKGVKMALDNKELYKKTLGFSVIRLGWNILAFVVFVAILAIAYLIADKAGGVGWVGLIVGLVIAGVLSYFFLRYIGYTYKAGQIAMMTRGIVDGKLPEDVIGTGKKIVKERFTTVAVYYAATGVIKGIFNQIGNAITSVGKAVGGDTGGAVGSTISSVIQTVVNYLCDCCLGWVFYRKDESAGKATCEGAVLFFKHGKTLAKNMGRVFGIGFVTLLVIGGAFMGISYLIFTNFPDAFAEAASKVAGSGEGAAQFLSNPNNLMIVCAAIVGVVFWAMIHSVFIKPFVLVGVLRNYINSGMNEKISESDFDELDKKSAKFKKLHGEVKAGA